MTKIIPYIFVAIITILLCAWISAQNIENPTPHKMWLIKTTHASNSPTIYYYKFQARTEMHCIAVFESKMNEEEGSNLFQETAWGAAVSVALTSQKVPCE